MADEPKRDKGRFPKGVSGNPAGRPKQVKQDAAPKSEPKADASTKQARYDGWMNWLSGHGIAGRDKRQGASFAAAVLTFDQLAELWRGDDLAARAVETLPKEAIRQGWDLTVPEDDEGGDESDRIAEIMDKLHNLGADHIIQIGLGYERGLGGGAVLIGANDGQADLTKPLDLNKVRSLDWLTPLEPREIQPIYGYADPRAPKYGQPEIYRITSRPIWPSPDGRSTAQASMEVHESRLLIFPGIRVSRYQQIANQNGWGDSVLVRMWRVLRDFNLAWGSAGALVTEFASAVYKFKDLWETLATDGGNVDFANRLQAMDLARSTINATVIDADDDFQRMQTPISGLPDLMDRFATRLAASADMPLTLLFGTSPAGMNATGESDIRFFYDRVASYQHDKVEPQLKQLIRILFRTLGNKTEPPRWNITFRPLWQESAMDKAKAILTTAQADQINIQGGVYSAEEAADSHWGTGEWTPDIRIDFDARERQEAATAGPVTENDLRAMGKLPPEYVPPPVQGTREATKPTAPRGPAAAPDTNTAPKSVVQAEDSADRFHSYLRQDDWTEELHPRDEAGKFSASFSTRTVANGEQRHVATFEHPATETRKVRQFRTRAAAEKWVQKQAREHEAIVHAADARILNQRTREGGGITYDPRTATQPHEGYSVAIHGDRERKLFGHEALDPQQIASYIKDNHDVLLKDPKAQVGAWWDEKKNTWFLDVPHVERSLDAAVKLGQQHKQLAIFDLKRFEEIRDHEYEDALARKGRFAGRLDGTSASRAGSAYGSAHHDTRGDGRGDAQARREGTRQVVRWDFSPDQARSSDGKWTSSGDESGKDAEGPKAGDSFVVYRLGSGKSGDLHGKNAGNAQGVADHISNMLDQEKPGQGQGFGDTVTAYRVKLKGPTDTYERMNSGGSSYHGKVGRDTDLGGGVRYSFPEAKHQAFEAEKIGSAKVSDLHEHLQKHVSQMMSPEEVKNQIGGRVNFESVGSVLGGDAIRSYFDKHRKDYDPGEARDPNGKWTTGGAVAGAEKPSVEAQGSNRAHHSAPKLSQHAESMRPAADAFLARHRATIDATIHKLESIATPGAKVTGRVKEVDSALEKLDRKPDTYRKPEDLWDGSGLRVTCRNLDELKQNVDAIKHHFHVVEENNYLEKPQGSYRSYHLQVKDKDGLMKEFQVRTPNQNRWADWCHDIYKPQSDQQRSSLKEHKDEIMTYAQKMSDYYYDRDRGIDVPKPPPCPPVLHTTFGCLD